jgi:hypothetical protein
VITARKAAELGHFDFGRFEREAELARAGAAPAELLRFDLA